MPTGAVATRAVVEEFLRVSAGGDPEEVAAHHRVFGDVCPPGKGAVTVGEILVDGSDAVLTGTSTQHVTTTGREFAMTFALHLTVENGLLTRHHMYEDSLAVAEAFER
ncbi:MULTISPECIES: nuclear transport factor 2 family protein [Thermomonosporaceae]|uniref:nuclear transport factor 2 family protein n=1 Tax=Thermomonosporaceae TaxID=2012 RepID=UPI00255AD06D|nr:MULTISPECIES: nuclear transport factor 2 family protein [Thermomonosporaceae]MDL4770837.1 hypothetical protein [Actinomadura xylanilytica]